MISLWEQIQNPRGSGVQSASSAAVLIQSALQAAEAELSSKYPLLRNLSGFEVSLNLVLK